VLVVRRIGAHAEDYGAAPIAARTAQVGLEGSMFDLASGWKTRLAGAVLPPRSEKAGWLIDHSAGPAFVEPALRTIQGDPFAARAIVVAAPGAVGKSTFARMLGAVTSSVLVDLARTELLGGNFFVGGIANAFGGLSPK
jgi:hypothetical protein